MNQSTNKAGSVKPLSSMEKAAFYSNARQHCPLTTRQRAGLQSCDVERRACSTDAKRRPPRSDVLEGVTLVEASDLAALPAGHQWSTVLPTPLQRAQVAGRRHLNSESCQQNWLWCAGGAGERHSFGLSPSWPIANRRNWLPEPALGTDDSRC